MTKVWRIGEREPAMDRWFDRSPYLYDENVFWEVVIGVVVVCATVLAGMALPAID